MRWVETYFNKGVDQNLGKIPGFININELLNILGTVYIN